MTTTLLQKKFLQACTDLNLEIDLNYEVVLPSGRRILALVRVAKIGAPNGTLVFTSFNAFGIESDDLRQNGYSWSSMSEPLRETPYDRSSFIRMFSEWGWAAPNEPKPYWMTEPVWDED